MSLLDLRNAASMVAAANTLYIDHMTAQVVGELEARGVPSIVLKGPVVEAMLYGPGEVRAYSDTDLLIEPSGWERAVETLAQLGYTDYLGPLAHPRMESQAGTGFMLDDRHSVDLHSTLHGLDADPDDVWRRLRAGAVRQTIGGRELLVPEPAAVVMHVALHAVHHVVGHPMEDLRRAVDGVSEETWVAAVRLADELQGLAAMASGLRLTPDGAALARRLDVEHAGSVHFDLRTEGVPMAEGLHGLLAADVPLRERATIVATELFPNPAFMRWWSPVARRGLVGLVASYPWRWVTLAFRLPAAASALRRAQRRRQQ